MYSGISIEKLKPVSNLTETYFACGGAKGVRGCEAHAFVAADVGGPGGPRSLKNRSVVVPINLADDTVDALRSEMRWHAVGGTALERQCNVREFQGGSSGYVNH